jgi:dihydroorotate dehydrogenase
VSRIERAGLAALHRLDPERAHGLALAALRLGLGPRGGPVRLPRLATRVAGLELANPLGLAAGFDKNAVALGALARAGFGFLEVGAATPLPQPGNPRPRLFRLSAERGVINRFGFNNDGAAAIAARLAVRPRTVPVGINLGANRDSPDRAGDFAGVLAACGPHADFATVNVSSPNTGGLRDLQGGAALAALLARVMEVRAGLARPIPVFVKLAPDLSRAALAEVVAAALDAGVAGIIATNTTTDRRGLSGPHAGEAGGLSGRPLFDRSTRVLAALRVLAGGRLALIGAGGIESAETAYAKIRAGADALQLYTALAFEGLGLVPRILAGLSALLARDGFADVAAAVGTAAGAWDAGGDQPAIS